MHSEPFTFLAVSAITLFVIHLADISNRANMQLRLILIVTFHLADGILQSTNSNTSLLHHPPTIT